MELDVRITRAVHEGLRITRAVHEGLRITRAGHEGLRITRAVHEGLRIVRTSKTFDAVFSRRHDFAGIGLYLQVNPETVWLTEANDFSDNFIVESNTDWTIQKEE